MPAVMRIRLAIIAALALSACGWQPIGKSWDLNQPIGLSLDSAELPADKVSAYLGAAVAQLGGTTQADAQQVVHVRYNAASDCYGCNPLTVAHTDYNSDTIQILPRYLLQPPNGLQDNITHELLHVLGDQGGDAGHTDPATHTMMTPRYDDRQQLHDPKQPALYMQYQLLDLQRVCGAGRLRGGVCDRLATQAGPT